MRDLLREWVLPYKQVEQALGERSVLCEQRAAEDGNVDPSPEDLVDYLDFADSFTLLNKNREMLPDGATVAVKQQTPSLEHFCPVRNRVMHVRPLQPDDPDLAVRLCTNLLDSPYSWPRLTGIARQLVTDPTWYPRVALHSAPARALHNLPVPDFDETGLIGRKEERRDLLQMLVRQRYPIITVLGEGGNGKTALAVQVLYDLIDHADCPYDVVLWQTLKSERLTAHGVEELTGNARDLIGMTHALGRPLDENFRGTIEDLADVLAGTKPLIVIDNLESAGSEEVIGLYEALPDETRCLFTSRVGLGQLERRFPLGTLEPNASELLFRKLAQRRSLTALAKLSGKQLQKPLDRLRYSPLAIRWFIEAVDSGAQPDQLLSDQSNLLRFCMETIHRNLSPEAQRLLTVLFVLDEPATVNDLALLSELPLDDLRRAVHDLQRRSFVEVAATSDGAALLYSIAPSAREYLTTVAPPAESDLQAVREKSTELTKSEEQRRLDEERDLLSPNVVTVDAEQHRPVAHLLRQALEQARVRNLDSVNDVVRQAEELAPDYFEVERVAALAESRSDPERACQRYERALDLAPSISKPKVAFFFAGHLAFVLRDYSRADPLAGMAHDALGLPETGLRLGQIKRHLGKAEEAELALTQVLREAGEDRTRIIAHSELCLAARERVKAICKSGGCDAGVRHGVGILGEAWHSMRVGLLDNRLSRSALLLATETARAAARVADLESVSDELAVLLEGVDRSAPDLARLDTVDLERSIHRVAARADCPEDVRLFVGKLDASFAQSAGRISAGRTLGTVRTYAHGKGLGLIDAAVPGEPLKFGPDELQDSEEAVFLVPRSQVSFVVARLSGDLRAQEVISESSKAVRQGSLRGRRGKVFKIEYNWLLAADKDTDVAVFAHRGDFAKTDEWHLVGRNDQIEYDIEITAKGYRARRGSVSLMPGG